MPPGFMQLLGVGQPPVAAAGPTANMAVARGAVAASGTVDITSSGFGDVDAAIIFISWATAEDTDTDGLSWNTYFWDNASGNEIGLSSADEDGQGTTDTETNFRNDVAIVDQTGALDATGGAVTQITDGIRITWGNNPGGTYRYYAIFFSGVTAHADYLSMSGSSGDAISYSTWDTDTGDSAAPDLVFFMSHASLNGPDHSQTGCRLSFGICVNDGSLTQKSTGMNSSNNKTTSAVVQRRHSDRVGNIANNNSDSYELTAFATTGFTVTMRTNSDKRCPYLAIGGLSNVHLAELTTPAATGNNATTGVGFAPDFLIACTDAHTAYGSGSTSLDMLLTIGAGDENDEASISSYSEDAVATSNSGSRHSSKLLQTYQSSTSAKEHTGAIVSLDADGHTINWTQLDETSTNKGFILSIGY